MGLRVLWLTERYPPLKGGMAVSCARQTRALRQRDIALDVVALGCLPAGAETIAARDRDGGVDYLVSRELPYPSAIQLAWRRILERHVAAPYTAVIGFGCNLPGYVAVTYAAWLNAPSPRGTPSLVLIRGNDFDRDWFDPRRSAWVREALARATAIGAVAPDTVRRVRALFPSARVGWTPNGIDAGQWDLLPAGRKTRDDVRADLGVDGRRIVGLFGDMKYKKRVPLWLGALRDTGLADKVGLLVVGDVDEETAQLLADPALAPRTRQFPFCDAEQLSGLYAACDFTVIPSLFDGMPNVLLEAMACGVVPIVSNAGAMGDVVKHGETGFVFAAENRMAAAEVTATALALDDDALAAMKGRARQHVIEHFSVAREVDALCALLHDIGGL